eukprot:TRINITY_DN32886_c0_g1_i1.p1 TRINITY_DN32886_c0_g1~~TRINITY_DN32886_c0_g1_i1.p1  ORF type:complete len:172 (+),score=20.60 TRINITY_DN32886_c0_g1_i1:64-579(+)
MDSAVFPEDIACPRCSWTLFTGGMDEDAHASVCGPLPGRSSPWELFNQSNGEDHPPYDIGACPMRQPGDADLVSVPAEPTLADALSAGKFFKFTFNVDEHFQEDGMLKHDALSNAMHEAKVPNSLNQPSGSVEGTVESIANDLAPKVRRTGEAESETFNQFSGTFMVEVLK